MHCAAINSHTEVTDLLIQARAMVNAQDIYRQTPLDLAAWNGHTDTVNLLTKAVDIMVDMRLAEGPVGVQVSESRSTPQAAEANPGTEYVTDIFGDHAIFSEDHSIDEIDSEDDGTKKKRKREEPCSDSQKTTQVGAGSGGAARDKVKAARINNTSGYRGYSRIALTVSEREHNILNQLQEQEQEKISMNELLASKLRETGIFNQGNQTIEFYSDIEKQPQGGAAGADAKGYKRTSLWVSPVEYGILNKIKDKTRFNITEIV